jgi:hypothetical protein
MERGESGSTDWAGSSFCTRYGVPTMAGNYKGVRACGDPFVDDSSNTQGTISYTTPSGNTVIFNSVGFQCVELVARYFYFQTTLIPDNPKIPPSGAAFVSTEHHNYPQITISGATDTFQNSITPGNIISMWSASDSVGHVAVVTGIVKSDGIVTGIRVMDENALRSGIYTITVTNGKMLYPLKSGGYNEFQWTKNLPGSG